MGLLSVELLVCLLLVAIYMIMSIQLERWKVSLNQFEFIHQSGICIILGFIAGLFLELADNKPAKFDSDIFFNFMLPFLILSAGYTMKRRRFFRNLGSIFLFGVLGTILCFLLIGIGAYGVSESQWIVDSQGYTMHISLNQALEIGAVLSASDVVCALSLVHQQKTPILHSILFGEAVVNDAIGILLYRSLRSVNLDDITAGTVFLFIGDFLYNCLASLLLGTFFGLAAALLTKHIPNLRNDSSNQTALLFYVSWIGYVLAQLIDISGVITILISSIIMGHYAWYNLTPAARETTTDTFRFLGNGAEALIFSYLGLTAITYFNKDSSIVFVLGLVLIVLVSRLVSTFGLVYLFRLISWGKYRISDKTVAVVWIAGTIRGAVAFALIARQTGNHSDLLKSSVLGLVIFTTLVFGTVLPIWIRIFKPTENIVPLKKIEPGNFVNNSEIEASDPLLEQKSITYFLTVEEVIKKKSWIHQKWRTLDDKYLKPCLILQEELEAQKREKSQLMDIAEKSVLAQHSIAE